MIDEFLWFMFDILLRLCNIIILPILCGMAIDLYCGKRNQFKEKVLKEIQEYEEENRA